MTHKWLSQGQNPPRISEFYTLIKIHKAILPICTRALFNLFRNVMNYSNLWKIDWKGKITLKIVQARGTHTPTQICAQPYHARSSSHGHLFGIYWGSSAWAGKTRVSKTLYYRGECKAKSTKCQLHATHVGRRIMGWCMCAPCFKFVFWKWWTKLLYCINNLKSLLYIANFSRC